jgi:hypothetical protein
MEYHPARRYPAPSVIVLKSDIEDIAHVTVFETERQSPIPTH